MDPVVHFEIPADNLERAQEFYNRVFGWKMQPIAGLNYTIVCTAETDEVHMLKESGRINGGMIKRAVPIMRPVITIQVQEMERALQKVRSAGGKIVKEPLAVGTIGMSAYVQDSEGNIIGLWQNLSEQAS